MEPMKGKIRTRPTKGSFLSPNLLNGIRHSSLKEKQKIAKRANILTGGKSLMKGFKMIRLSNFSEFVNKNQISYPFLLY